MVRESVSIRLIGHLKFHSIYKHVRIKVQYYFYSC